MGFNGQRCEAWRHRRWFFYLRFIDENLAERASRRAGANAIYGAARKKAQVLESATDRLDRNVEAMCEKIQVPSGELAFSIRGLREAASYSGRGHEERRRKEVSESLGGRLLAVAGANLCLAARGQQVCDFVRERPCLPGATMIRVQDNARAEFWMVGEDSGDARCERANEDAHSEVQLGNREDVGNRAESETKLIPKLERKILGLLIELPTPDLSLGWILEGRRFAQASLQLDSRCGKLVEQANGGGRLFGRNLRAHWAPKLGYEINVHCVAAEEGVDRRLVEDGEQRELLWTNGSLAAFNRDDRRARDLERLRNLVLG